MNQEKKRLWREIIAVWVVVLALNRLQMFLFNYSFDSDFILLSLLFGEPGILVWLFIFTQHAFYFGRRRTTVPFGAFLVSLITSTIFFFFGSPVFLMYISFLPGLGVTPLPVRLRGFFILFTVMPALFYLFHRILAYEKEKTSSGRTTSVVMKSRPFSFRDDKTLVLAGGGIWTAGMLFNVIVHIGSGLPGMLFSSMVYWSLWFAEYVLIILYCRYWRYQNPVVENGKILACFFAAYLLASFLSPLAPLTSAGLVLLALLFKEGQTANWNDLLMSLPSLLSLLPLYFFCRRILKRR